MSPEAMEIISHLLALAVGAGGVITGKKIAVKISDSNGKESGTGFECPHHMHLERNNENRDKKIESLDTCQRQIKGRLLVVETDSRHVLEMLKDGRKRFEKLDEQLDDIEEGVGKLCTEVSVLNEKITDHISDKK